MKRMIAAAFAVAIATAAHADAAKTYASKCAMCHGKDGKGAKVAPKPIAGLPAAEVKAAITDGKGKMKPVKIEDAAEVADYVAGLK